MKKICDKCFKEINAKKEDYHEVRTYSMGHLVITKFIHKKCSDEMNAMRDPKFMQDIMNRAVNMLGGLGIAKEYEIK